MLRRLFELDLLKKQIGYQPPQSRIFNLKLTNTIGSIVSRGSSVRRLRYHIRGLNSGGR